MLKMEKFSDCAEDVALYNMLVLNETVMHMNLGRVFTPEEAEAFYRMMLSSGEEAEALGYFKVYDANTGVFLGMGALNGDGDTAEIEYMLLPEHWGQGYGTMLVAELLGKARSEGMTEIIALTDPDNAGSRKVLTRNGFVSEGVEINSDGEQVERLVRHL